MTPLPNRKRMRHEHFDYSQNGAYFITLCIKDNAPLLSEIITEHSGLTDNQTPSIIKNDEFVPVVVKLTSVGEIVNSLILDIPVYHPYIDVPHFVIMPNHIHLIFVINNLDDEFKVKYPHHDKYIANNIISNIIRGLKSFTTKKVGNSIWQTSYYDHIIRDQDDFNTRAQYILFNPLRWKLDEYYISK